jgi:peptidyl-prolyl cis-trans isomerase C
LIQRDFMNTKHLAAALLVAILQVGTVQAEDLNPVVGKVGDFVMREADFERLLSSQPPEVQQTVKSSPEQRTSFIRQFLLTKAVAAKARNEGFDRKPEIRELLANLLDQYIANRYVAKEVTATATVTDEELKAYYREHEKELLLPEAVRARHILILAAQQSPSPEKAKARARAEHLLEQVRKGEDFAQLAREHSDDRDSGARGGELGLLSPGGTNSPEFEKAVFALKSGEVSGIVETAFGYEIIKVDQRSDRRPATFEESREYIRNLLREQNRQKTAQQFLETLARETGLEVVTEKPAEVKP